MSIYMYLLLYPILESFFWSFSFVTACRRSAYFSPRFNPRPRTGGDPCSQVKHQISIVSIHAPARGATASATIEIMQLPCFNPRPRTGGDIIVLCPTSSNHRFNPRPRTGGDRSLITRYKSSSYQPLSAFQFTLSCTKRQFTYQRTYSHCVATIYIYCEPLRKTV